MTAFGIYDVLGPIMIGPSSSHTAGACRLGKVANEICGEKYKKVDFYLHGSFAKTYKGHGTDRALIAGILGMSPDNYSLENSINIAKDKGIETNFYTTDLGNCHENTAKILFTLLDNSTFYVIGSSIGGGNIIITNINGFEVTFTADYPTLVIRHYDKKGVINNVTNILARLNINVGTMMVNRRNPGQTASMVIETDTPINKEDIQLLNCLDNIISIRIVNPVA